MDFTAFIWAVASVSPAGSRVPGSITSYIYVHKVCMYISLHTYVRELIYIYTQSVAGWLWRYNFISTWLFRRPPRFASHQRLPCNGLHSGGARDSPSLEVGGSVRRILFFPFLHSSSLGAYLNAQSALLSFSFPPLLAPIRYRKQGLSTKNYFTWPRCRHCGY